MSDVVLILETLMGLVCLTVGPNLKKSQLYPVVKTIVSFFTLFFNTQAKNPNVVLTVPDP